MAVLPEQQGVIPRAVIQLFSTIDQLRDNAIASGDPPPQFEITAQFLEVSCLIFSDHSIFLWVCKLFCFHLQLYNEDLIDLFDCNREAVS